MGNACCVKNNKENFDARENKNKKKNQNSMNGKRPMVNPVRPALVTECEKSMQ